MNIIRLHYYIIANGYKLSFHFNFKKTINSFKINVIITTIQCFALNKVSKAKKKIK